jgi:hypothetical protein
MWAVVLNTILSLGFLITLLFCIGDVDAALSTPTGFPTIQILLQATNSKAGATIIFCMILLSTMIALFGVLASVSRLTWAFARDNGLPFSEFFAHVSRRLGLERLQLTVSDSSDATYSFKRSLPCHHHCRLAWLDQYRQYHRLQCYSLARYDGPVSFPFLVELSRLI